MPPSAHGVKVISIGMFTPGGNSQPVVWRGPMLHRALQQFLADVYWGDLDVLLLDLPPGTGDIAISVAQLLPNAEILVVTTPQQAAAEVAERAGCIAVQTHQQIAGVIENMSGVPVPALRRADRGVRLRRRHGRRQTLLAGRWAPTSRCSARSRSTYGCARAATTAARSCSPTRTRRPRRSCASIAQASATARAGSSACPWASRRPVAELRSPVPAPGIGVPSAQSRPTRAATARRKETAPCSSR